jgi:hypothetical protein
MNIFFKTQQNSNLKKKILEFKKNDTLLVKYYDQYKYIHTIEGKCIARRSTKGSDFFVSIYVKTKNMYFSFFQFSPLIVAILKKKT